MPRVGGSVRLALWLVDLAAMTDDLLAVERAMPRLADDERTRAARLAGEARQRRLATYVALRILLEGAFGPRLRGAALPRAANGRPSLDGLVAAGDFSLSHGDDVALIALSDGARIGIDLERERPLRMTLHRQQAIVTAAAAMAAGSWDGAVDVAHDDGARRPSDASRLIAAWVRIEAFAKAYGLTLARVLTRIGAIGGDAPASRDELVARLDALRQTGTTASGPVTVRGITLPAAAMRAGPLHAAVALAATLDPGADLGPRLVPAAAEALGRLAAGEGIWCVAGARGGGDNAVDLGAGDRQKKPLGGA